MPRRSYKNSRSRNTRSRYGKRRNVGRMSRRGCDVGGGGLLKTSANRKRSTKRNGGVAEAPQEVVTKKTTASPSVASLRRLPVLPHSEQLGKIHELQETEKFKGHRPLFTAEVIDMIEKFQKDNPKLNTKLSCSLAVATILQNGHKPTYNGNTSAVGPLKYGLVEYYKTTENTDFEKRYTTLLNDRNNDYILDEINRYLK